MVTQATTGMVQAARAPGSRPSRPNSSSAKNVARAPMAAGVETSRNSQPKTNAAASP